MSVRSVSADFHNLRLWEIEGCAQIYASLQSFFVNSLRAVFFFCGDLSSPRVVMRAHSKAVSHAQQVTVVCRAGRINQAGMWRLRQQRP